jgi:predicted alpha/beta hydrolase family esterase
MKVLLIHGWGGSDFPHWQSWLASEIAKDYGCVSFLRFSDVDFPNLDEWETQLVKHLDDFKPDIVICHSLANTLWFHLCNKDKIKINIEKLYLVAPPRIDCDIDELKTFFPVTTPKDLNAKEILLITSTNDPYMDIEEANKLQKELDVDMEMLDNVGHINADSGFGEWPWMLEKIKGDIK